MLAVLALAANLAAPPPPALDAFFSALQRAIEHHDRRAVAAMVHYPIKVLASGWIIPLSGPDAFVKYYDAIVTEEIKDLVADAKTGAARNGPLVTLGHDSVRIMRIGAAYKIIGITIPPPSGKVRAARRATTTVQFDNGLGTAKYSGSLAVGEHESYVLHAGRNELLDVRIEQVRGRDIVAHVVDAETGKALDDRARDGVRVWTGRVPAAGAFRIDIVREARGGDVVLTYALIITLR